MELDELERAIAEGVVFWGYELDGELVGVMGIQAVGDVELIRHAYVLPGRQGHGIGRALLEHLQGLTAGRLLVGTWAAADWAVRFYRRNGFELVSPELKTALLETYWRVPERQIETSVVLANPPLEEGGSAADVRHLDPLGVGGRGGAELRVAIAAGAPDGAECGGQLVVGGAAAQQRAQIVALDGEEAGVDLAVGGEAGAGAVAAEGLSHRGDDADLAAAVAVAPARGHLAAVGGLDRLERELGVDLRTISAAGTTSSSRQPFVWPTSMNSMKRSTTPVPVEVREPWGGCRPR